MDGSNISYFKIPKTAHPKNILYVGELLEGRTSNQRMQALQDLGHRITAISYHVSARPLFSRIHAKIGYELGFPVDAAKTNWRIIFAATNDQFEILWLDKTIMIKPGTIRTFRKMQPQCLVVFYSPDDMINPSNQSHYYISSLPLFDVHFTTKSFNVNELERLGCRNVVFVENAYDPHTHRPWLMTPAEEKRWRTDVGFVGAYELNALTQCAIWRPTQSRLK